MTHKELAELICLLPADEWAEMADVLFDEVEKTYPATDVDIIFNQLLEVGVDVRPICKRKHPAS